MDWCEMRTSYRMQRTYGKSIHARFIHAACMRFQNVHAIVHCVEMNALIMNCKIFSSALLCATAPLTFMEAWFGDDSEELENKS